MISILDMFCKKKGVKWIFFGENSQVILLDTKDQNLEINIWFNLSNIPIILAD